VAKILVVISVYGTFGLQFSVCLDIAWRYIKKRGASPSLVANYTLRTILATVTVLLGVALPQISPFIGLLGAVCFSLLGILTPVYMA
jgi:solute carrier family 36 (proton-coupled amino acid transporter)